MTQPPVGFLCYARFDDEYENGRLSELRQRLSAEVRFQTGNQELDIFQDQLPVDGWQRGPHLPGGGFIPCPNCNPNNFAGVPVKGQPDPLFVPFVPNKRPHFIALDRQSAFFCAYPHFAGDVGIVLVDIGLQPTFGDLDGPGDPRQRDFSSSNRSIRALVASEMIRN